ncbi:thioredoxin reductase (NADPH) [Marinilactibacillus piezotolerans]|uniref:Ferredoxin--NADP reductase n=1 Tax=Marinilactibacillus piezotolerans TaxID=258723 RepID=A0A1I4AX50_9LACT|nr:MULTISPECIES: NAD(P)/FAD-dependent oxidoreductase [Marinilactibacillus]SFK60239.1 thioredoxin reductase (NADPH) [Marinilactibacillus piezotolerans]
MVNENEIYDITIIGGGPVGMFSAFYSGMRNAKTKLIETLPVLGGQVALLYPDKKIYDIGGHAAVTGKELIKELTAQMDLFDQQICLEEQVEEIIKRDDDIFELRTAKGKHYSKTVIVTTGQGAFKPRKLTVENAELYEEQSLQYIVNNLEQYKDKTVAVCGGGDSAVDWALTLEPIANKVYLIHRRDKFRAHEASVEQVKNSSIELMTPYIPYKLNGTNEELQSVTFKKSKGDETKTIDLDFFVVNYGFSSSIGPLRNWNIELDRNEIIVNHKMETSVEGIYAAGDVSTYDGKIKLIATGFGEAPTAVNHAIHYIRPKEHAQPYQSTKLSFDK